MCNIVKLKESYSKKCMNQQYAHNITTLHIWCYEVGHEHFSNLRSFYDAFDIRLKIQTIDQSVGDSRYVSRVKK